MVAVPELVVQALDKLMDNAVSFTEPAAEIQLQLVPSERQAAHWEIRVSNQGPPLPRALQEKLFEPMVSLREGESDAPHLGLGLHVVKLISDFHGGRVYGENLEDGVRFTLSLPQAVE